MDYGMEKTKKLMVLNIKTRTWLKESYKVEGYLCNI
jgi:hypothetical protein